MVDGNNKRADAQRITGMVLEVVRRFHALSQPKMLEKAHEYCAIALRMRIP
jgi:hypothetical protein